MRDFETTADLVRIWRRKHDINNPDKQMLKVVEETSEAVREIVRGNYDSEELKDSIGDILITVVVLADILKIDPIACFNMAYDTIKGREGKTIDGSFVKQQDLKENK